MFVGRIWFHRIMLAASVVLAQASMSQAQNGPAIVEEMHIAFQQLNYMEAKEAGQKALESWRRLTPQNLIDVHKILAIIAYSEGNFFEAKSQFEQALSLDPGLSLDSLYVSPKIQLFLEQVRTNLSPANGHNHVSSRYLVLPDPRPKAAFRSLFVPGLGQLYKKEKTKGRILMLAAGAGLVATGALHVRWKSARANYLNAQTIAKAELTYKRYNTLNRARNAAALFTAAVWAYSFLDAMLTLPKQPDLKVNQIKSIDGASLSASLAWQIHF